MASKIGKIMLILDYLQSALGVHEENFWQHDPFAIKYKLCFITDTIVRFLFGVLEAGSTTKHSLSDDSKFLG